MGARTPAAQSRGTSVPGDGGPVGRAPVARPWLTRHVPDRALVATIARRGFGIWVGVRLMAAAGFAFALMIGGVTVPADSTGASMLRLSPPTALWVVAVCAVLSHLELHRRHEVVMLRNLGVGPAAYLVLAVIPAVLAEGALFVVPW